MGMKNRRGILIVVDENKPINSPEDGEELHGEDYLNHLKGQVWQGPWHDGEDIREQLNKMGPNPWIKHTTLISGGDNRIGGIDASNQVFYSNDAGSADRPTWIPLGRLDELGDSNIVRVDSWSIPNIPGGKVGALYCDDGNVWRYEFDFPGDRPEVTEPRITITKILHLDIPRGEHPSEFWERMLSGDDAFPLQERWGIHVPYQRGKSIDRSDPVSAEEFNTLYFGTFTNDAPQKTSGEVYVAPGLGQTIEFDPDRAFMDFGHADFQYKPITDPGFKFIYGRNPFWDRLAKLTELQEVGIPTYFEPAVVFPAPLSDLEQHDQDIEAMYNPSFPSTGKVIAGLATSILFTIFLFLLVVWAIGERGS